MVALSVSPSRRTWARVTTSPGLTSQRTTSGQPKTLLECLEDPDFPDRLESMFDSHLRRIVNEEVSALLSSVVSDEVTAESSGLVPSTSPEHLYPTDLYDVVRVLEMAMERDHLKPPEYWLPMIGRLKKAADAIK